MCAPVIAAVALGVTSATQQYLQIQAQNKAASAEEKAARIAEAQDYQALQDQRQQINQVAGQQSLEAALDAKRRAATTKVSFGEANVLGNTPARQLAALEVGKARELGTIETNRSNALRQNQRQVENVGATASSRVSSARSKMSSGVSAGLQIAGAGVQGAWSGYQFGTEVFPRNRLKIPPANSPQNRYITYH